ncbi:Hsp70 family protein [Rhodococcus sp. NPDC003318]|uniref:Hsp70 family protein n=1 Tax=Rhodococcus sp. NPDC003318 TaxID=3364503 RepID=UPI0036AA6D98
MATGLGLTVGSTNSVAVTDSLAGSGGGALAGSGGGALSGSGGGALSGSGGGALSGSGVGASTITVPTALTLGETGPVLFGGSPAGAVISGYADRVGDPVPLIADDGSAHAGAALVATTMRALADESAPADAVTAAHPAAWSEYQADVLSAALVDAGLPGVTLVPEPVAAAAWLRHTHPGIDDSPVVVYDLGAGSLDVTVVRPGEQPEILGTPLRSEDFSGARFDHATLRHVLDAMAVDADGMDPFDAATVAALAELRSRCRVAKEALSSDTDTVIAVDLPGVHTDVRLVREELEELIREPIAESVNVVHEAVRGAGLELSDIGLVLLTGGGAAIPLVTESLSTTLRLPLVADIDPTSTAAAGAAVLAAELAAAPAAQDTAVLAALGAVLPAAAAHGADDAPTSTLTPIASPAPAPAPAPRRRGGGLLTPKRTALVTAAAAAIAVLAAGGLALGTGASTPTSGSPSTGDATSSQTTTDATAPGSVAATVNPDGSLAPAAGSGSTQAGASAGASAGTGSGSAAQPVNAANPTAAGAPAGAAAAATQAGAAAPAAPAATVPAAPAATVPAATVPAATAPAVSQPTVDGGQIATGVGEGVGGVVNGVGQGVGGVVSGVGQGVGGVVGGLGEVVSGVGGVVGGLAGN